MYKLKEGGIVAFVFACEVGVVRVLLGTKCLGMLVSDFVAELNDVYEYNDVDITSIIREYVLDTSPVLTTWVKIQTFERNKLIQDYSCLPSPLFRSLPKEYYDKSYRYSSKTKVM